MRVYRANETYPHSTHTNAVDRASHTKSTYTMPPAHFVHPRIRFDVAFEVDVRTLAHRRCRVQIAAQLQRHDRHVFG